MSQYLFSNLPIRIILNQQKGECLVYNRGLLVPVGCKLVEEGEHELEGDGAEELQTEVAAATFEEGKNGGGEVGKVVGAEGDF